MVNLYLLDGYTGEAGCFHCVCLLVDRLIKNTKNSDAQLSKLDKTLELLKTPRISSYGDDKDKTLKDFLMAVRDEISNEKKNELNSSLSMK